MILNEKRISDNDKKSGIYSIYCIGDIHLGNKVCDLNKLRRDIDYIKTDPYAYWIGMGDMIEAINYSDSRFDPSQIDSKYLGSSLSNICTLQFEDVMTLLKPIMDKCIGLHRGNHEETIRLYHHFDLMYEIKRLYREIPLLEDTAFTKLVFERQGHIDIFILWSAHGSVAGRRTGSKINKIEDAMGWFDADIYLLAHGHRKVISSSTRLEINRRGKLYLKAKRRVGGMTGSYFKTYQEGTSTYGEKKMYSPSDLGCIKAVIQPSQNKFYLTEVT